MNDELMRRISDALDAEGGPEGDAELRALLAEDGEAAAYAEDLERIDAALRGFGARQRREPDWDALAARVEARLDEQLEVLDADEPPRFDDEARTRGPAVSQEVPAMRAAAPAAPPAEATAQRAPAPVVDLASRRRSGVVVWLGGIAAAAAVGLGITFGVTTLDAPHAEMAAAPATQDAPSAVPAEAEAAWEGAVAEAPADEAPGLGAAAAAMPLAPPAPAPEPAAVAPPAQAARAERDAPFERMGSGGTPRPRGGAVALRMDEPAAPPSRAAVLSALASVEPAVQRCLARRGEVARVTMQVGAHGRVVSVRVSPPYAGAEATCIVDALHSAELPASPTDYPFAHQFRPAAAAGGSLARPATAARRQRAAPPPSRQANEVTDAFSR